MAKYPQFGTPRGTVVRLVEPERSQRRAIDRYRRERLIRVIPWARRTRFYKRHLSNVRSAAWARDLSKLPLTSKEDLLRSMRRGRTRYPSNCWCPHGHISIVGSTGGPGALSLAGTGSGLLPVPARPVDLIRRAYVAARAFSMAGPARRRPIGPTILMHETSLNIVHEAMVHGLSSIGGSPLTLGRGSTMRHLTGTFTSFSPLNIVTYPTYAGFLAKLASDADVELCFENAFLWGEPGGSVGPVRERLSKALGAQVHDIYAMQELGVLAAECKAHRGLHGFEDQFAYEIIDPSTGEVLEDGGTGELVVTDLHRSAFPLVRYRTGDITSIERGRCRCGRTHLRLMGIKGRVREAVREGDGPPVYPADIMDMLERNPHVTGVFRIVPGIGTCIETKENRQMAAYYLDKMGRPPGALVLERVLPKFLHRTEFVVGSRYEVMLKEQVGKEK